jgi:hypothetical protein
MAAIVFFMEELFFFNGNRAVFFMPQSMDGFYKRADELAV